LKPQRVQTARHGDLVEEVAARDRAALAKKADSPGVPLHLA
jgi:hypothetical protein